MTIKDERFKERTLQAIALQEQGFFVLDRNQELPLPTHPNLLNLRFTTSRDETGRFYDYETDWGKFGYPPGSYNGLLILRKGTPPPELIPQPRIELATATIHTGFVTIHNNGTSFDLDFQSRDRLDYNTLRSINQTLAGEKIPIAVWQVDEVESETPPIIRINNDSAMLFASSAIWSTQDQQLVSAQVVTTSQELLKAIKATLANNNGKSYLTVKTPDDSAYLRSARKGFITDRKSVV